MICLPHTSTLFPYTTLFRSHSGYPHDIGSLSKLSGSSPASSGSRGGMTASIGSSMAIQRRGGADESFEGANRGLQKRLDRKSTRLNSSHVEISYAVFCMKNR